MIAPPSAPCLNVGILQQLIKRLLGQDFVKLAKWEDRGHYAQKQEAEKSQRQLHKMVRDSQEVLKRPAAGVLGTVSAAMGFQDVMKHQQEEGSETERLQPARKKAKHTVKQPWRWQDQVSQWIMYLGDFMCLGVTNAFIKFPRHARRFQGHLHISLYTFLALVPSKARLSSGT